jgi:hypothetical protein
VKGEAEGGTLRPRVWTGNDGQARASFEHPTGYRDGSVDDVAILAFAKNHFGRKPLHFRSSMIYWMEQSSAQPISSPAQDPRQSSCSCRVGPIYRDLCIQMVYRNEG